ncbi:hypothetical protein DL96DRAFT_1819875 [Flagelloscypha sp. PMI_526]|nr:hypothetical protein DL96DRAFT_1819875 [Flagelloscypha sp. PMI_526]
MLFSPCTSQMLSINFLFFIASFPLAAWSAPSPFSSRATVLPDNVKVIAADVDTNRIIGFDENMNELGVFDPRALGIVVPGAKRQAAPSCVTMRKEDIEKVPGIAKLREEADNTFGTGSRNEVVNDPDFPENSANICSDPNGAVIVYDSEPKCNEITNNAGGTSPAEGQVSVKNGEGFKMTSSQTVTTESSFSAGATLGASFTFPGIGGLNAEFTTSSSFTNTQSNVNEIEQNLTQEQTFTAKVIPGQQCDIFLKTRSCATSGKGSLKMIAQGFLWFQYEDLTNGHFKWALRMEDVLPNVDDRSSPVQFQAVGNSQSSSNFGGDGCEKDGGEAPASA